MRLNFLGFPWILSSESRLIKGLRGKTRESFSRRFLPQRRSETTDRAPPVEAMRNDRIAHRASLVQFLIFCKHLSPDPFQFRPSMQSARAKSRARSSRPRARACRRSW
jgi:hypothetical protein